MHRTYVGALAASFLLAATLPAMGAGVGSAAESAGNAVGDAAAATGNVIERGAEATGNAVTGAARRVGNALGITGGESVTAAEAARYANAEKAEHQVTGTITNIDRDDGMVRLSTKEAVLELPFEPESIRSLQDGQQASVQLGYVKLPVPENPQRNQQTQATGREARAEHWMKGTVKDLDRSTGKFSLDTAGVTAQLRFPPAKLSDVREGDRVAVEVALASQPTSQNQR